MLVVTHYAVEKIDIENFIGLIRFENYHITTSGTTRYLDNNLLKPLMKIS